MPLLILPQPNRCRKPIATAVLDVRLKGSVLRAPSVDQNWQVALPGQLNRLPCGIAVCPLDHQLLANRTADKSAG